MTFSLVCLRSMQSFSMKICTVCSLTLSGRKRRSLSGLCLDMSLAVAEMLKGQRNASSMIKNTITKYSGYKYHVLFVIIWPSIILC